MLKMITVAMVLATVAATAATAESEPSPYAGQQMRQIKGLSPQDIDDLRHGRGWGLAKPAELNGVPGPTHLLDMADQIGLDSAQVAQLRAIKEEMTAQAKPLGEKLIALEAELDRQFASGTITDASLRQLLAQIAETRRDLRYTHLATHFKTPPLLTAEQIATYKRLRGYTMPPGGGPHHMQGGAHGGHGGH